MKEFVRIKLVDVDLLRRSLRKLCEEVIDSAVELRVADKDNDINFKEELATIGVGIGWTFEDQYCQPDNKISSLYKLQSLGGCFRDLNPKSR